MKYNEVEGSAVKYNEVQKPLTENRLRRKMHAVILTSLCIDYFPKAFFITLHAVLTLMISSYR